VRKCQTGTRVFTEAQVDALHAMCGLPKARCVVFLKDHGGHVANTLAALIDKGVVRSDDLDSDTVPAEYFARAAQREREAAARTEHVKRLAKKLKKTSKEAVAQLREVIGEPSERQRVGAWGSMLECARRRMEALEDKPVVVDLPPLPLLRLTLNGWVGTDMLKSWAGFGEKRSSRGKVDIGIRRAHEDRDDAPVPPAKEMVAAYAHLKEHEVEVRDAVLTAVQSYINDTLIGEYDWSIEPVRDVKALKRMMKLDSVHPLTIAKKGMSYLGLFFHCTWDPEHGGGVLLHGSRVITVGDNEAAGDDVAAFRDGGKRLRRWKSDLDKFAP
jgi:hypothetical protein